MHDRNHQFALGPIPKTKLKLAVTFGRYSNRYRNHISKGESSYQYQDNLALVWGIFFIIKGALKTKFACKFWILLDYFWRYGFIFMLIKTYNLPRSGKHEKNLKKNLKKFWKNLKKFEKKVPVSVKKKIRLWYQYRNWTLVSVLNTQTWFRSYTSDNGAIYLSICKCYNKPFLER